MGAVGRIGLLSVLVLPICCRGRRSSRPGLECSLTNLAKALNGADQLFLARLEHACQIASQDGLTEPGTVSGSPGSSSCRNDHVAEVGDSHTSSYWPGTTYQGKFAPADGER